MPELPPDVISQPNAIEEYFCKPFDILLPQKTLPMTKSTTELLARLLLTPAKAISVATLNEVRDKSMIFRIIENWFRGCTVLIRDVRLMMFLDILAEGQPGMAAMYTVYVQYWAKKHDRKEIDLHIFCQNMFPMGFLPEIEMERLWDGQKVAGHGNLLDHWDCAQSIQF